MPLSFCAIFLVSKDQKAHRDAPMSAIRGKWVNMRVRSCLACGVILTLQLTASPVRADACQSILDQIKSAADRATREVSSTGVNLQEAISQVSDDKRRVALVAQSCAASAEAVGVLKSYRIVFAECTGDRETGRSDALDRLDRSISQIRVMLDKGCR